MSGAAQLAGLHALAVDDEVPALDELAYLLRADARIDAVSTAGDATEALRQLRNGEIDVVFLDIRMPGLDGLELARVLRQFAAPPLVVFVTAHDDRAVDAFELGAVDYLLKPLRPDRLAAAVGRVAAARDDRVGADRSGGGSGGGRPDDDPRRAGGGNARAEVGRAGGAPPGGSGPGNGADRGGDRAAGDRRWDEEVIPVELAGRTTMLARSDVRWVEAQGDYARLHTAAGSHLVRVPMSLLEERWADAGFIRIHRSYLVALPLIRELRLTGGGYVVHIGDRELPVSRRHTRRLKDRLVRAAKLARSSRERLAEPAGSSRERSAPPAGFSRDRSADPAGSSQPRSVGSAGERSAPAELAPPRPRRPGGWQ